MSDTLRESMLDGIDAVIFDMDGTIVDSMWIWKNVDNDFFEKYQIDSSGYDDSEIDGLGFTETAEFFKERYHMEASVEEIKDFWNDMAIDKYRTQTELKPGLREFLDLLRSRGIRIGISTSNSQLLVDEFLSSRGVTDCFEAITTVCDVNTGKPSPDVYLATADKLGVPPERCLVFEDIPMGILAGKNAGMRVCAVEDSYSEGVREEKQELADFYIHDFTELF